MGIKSTMSTSYHPETDGQTEWINQELKQYLRVYCNHHQSDWVEFLHMAEFSYNNQKQDSIDMSPFYTNYGFHPRVHIAPMENDVPAVGTLVDKIHHIQEEAAAAMNRASDDMKRFADRSRQEVPEWNEGDQVMLDMRNIKTDRPSKKLDNRRTGPYKILKKLSDLNYKLQLPRKWKIHPIFHALLLYKYDGDSIPSRQLARPPPIEVEGENEYEVELIKDSRLRGRGTQYYVSWKGYPDADDSWESEADLKHAKELIKEFHQKYPQAPRRIAATIFESIPWRPYDPEDHDCDHDYDRMIPWVDGSLAIRSLQPLSS